MSRRVAVVLTFFFAAKSYVQKSCVLPMSSAGGVVRTGSKPIAGWQERPRTVRVSSNPFAYGSDLARSAAVMSRLESVDDASGVGVLGTAEAEESAGQALVPAWGATHPARRRTSARKTQRGRVTVSGTPRRAVSSRRPDPRGSDGAARAGGYR